MTYEINWNARAAALKAEMDSGKCYASYDEFQQVKDDYWYCIAQARKTTSGQINPVGFWHARMSN